MPMPASPKIYHIVHVDRLASILAAGGLLCDAEIVRADADGTTIGMGSIKQRRLNELRLGCHPDLYVGGCVPFYFCPRSVMLYLIHRGNHPELAYQGGQAPVVHLEADLRRSVAWAEQTGVRWAFTLSNAGAYYFEDRCDLSQLDEIDWDAVQSTRWAGHSKEGKQAEFLIERSFPWELVERVGVHSQGVAQQVYTALTVARHKPRVEIRREWYY